MAILEIRPQAVAPEGPPLRERISTSLDLTSVCDEVRTSLTIMLGAHRLARHAGDHLDPVERCELVQRAGHHAERAQTILRAAARALERG